jgi:hypothetical protein
VAARGEEVLIVRGAPTVFVGLAIPLAACGGSDAEVEPGAAAAPATSAAAIAAAARDTLAAGTARLSVTVVHTTSDATWGIEAGEREKPRTGVVDFGERRVALGSDATELVFDGTTVYFRDENQPDERWRKHDLRDLSSNDLAEVLLRRFDAVHLLAFVASLTDFGPVVREMKVQGGSATHYSAYLENEAITRAFVPGVSYEELAESEAYPVPVSQWTDLDVRVDEAGRVFEIAYDFDVFGGLFGERTIFEFSDFGADVEVSVPSPEETVDG